MTRSRRWLTPASILSTVALVALVVALFAPQDSSDSGRPLSSYSVSLSGSRGLFDVLRRLGHSVDRRTISMSSSLDSTATYMILQPSIPLTAVELDSLLAATRRGATIVFTGGRGSLDDSLGFDMRPAAGFHTIASTVVVGGNPPHTNGASTSANTITAVPISGTVSLDRKSSARDTAFMWLVDSPTYGRDERAPDLARALVLGRTFGKGHAIAVATPDLLSNRLMRDSRPAIAIERALEWADAHGNEDEMRSEAHASAVVFDEYHHGYGSHADVVGAVQHALISTPLGRMALQALVAAIVLLIAVGARPLAPASTSTFQRRSPLEHVGALAHAYLQVDARRIGAERLVQGLRRRHPLGVPRSSPHDVYFAALRGQLPSTVPEVSIVSAALTHESGRGKPGSFATIGSAIADIERNFKG